MNELGGQLKQAVAGYIDQAEEFAALCILEIQHDEHLQQLLLAFIVGAAFGWFIRSRVVTSKLKAANRAAGKRGTFGAMSGKTKEEVELNARRRL
jgi:hypothetical protein